MLAETSMRLADSSRTVPDHPGLHPRGRRELDGDRRGRAAAHHGGLLAQARAQAGRQRGVPLVTPPGPHEHPHERRREQRQEHPEAYGEPPEDPRQGGADQPTARGVGAALPQVGGQVAERAAGVGGQHAGALLGGEVGHREPRGPSRGGPAGGRRPVRAVEAGRPGRGHRAGDGGGDVVLREAAGGVDDVVVELGRAVADVVDDVGQPVADHVVLDPAHRLRGAADPDLAEGAEVGDRDVGGRPGGARDLDPAELVVPVLRRAVAVPGADPHVAVDAVPLLPVRELPADVLGDLDRPVGVDDEVGVQAGGALLGGERGGGTAPGGRRGAGPAPGGDRPGDGARRCRGGRRGDDGQPGEDEQRREGHAGQPRSTPAPGAHAVSPRRAGGPTSHARPRAGPGARAGRAACRRPSCP